MSDMIDVTNDTKPVSEPTMHPLSKYVRTWRITEVVTATRSEGNSTNRLADTTPSRFAFRVLMYTWLRLREHHGLSVSHTGWLLLTVWYHGIASFSIIQEYEEARDGATVMTFGVGIVTLMLERVVVPVPTVTDTDP